MNFAALSTIEKNALINTAIVAGLKAGLSIDQAVDAVMGEGSYKRIAGIVYHSLRGEAA